MKNFYILLLITIALLSGCSKASQTGAAVKTNGTANATSAASAEQSSSSVFAYIPYMSGRIDSYRLDNGKMTKMGEVRVGWPRPPVADPSGKYLYIADDKGIITRFAIGADGALTDPVPFKPNLNNQIVDDLVMEPSGKWLYLTSNAGDIDGNVIGSITKFNVAADGTLTQAGKVEFHNGVNQIVIAPSGDYLFARGRNWLQSYKIGADGGLSEANQTIDLNQSSTVMGITADGNTLVLDQTGGEQAFLAYCSIKAGEVKRLSEVVIPAVAMPMMVTFSVAMDRNGNILTISGNNWLTSYKVRGGQISELENYINYRNHTWTTRREAEITVPSTPEYSKYLQSDTSQGKNKEWKAMRSAVWELSSYLASVKAAPDGNFYASSSSGVYRFKSTADGIVYDSPAITWQDTAHLFRGITQVSGQQKKDAEQIADGMIFVQRK